MAACEVCKRPMMCGQKLRHLSCCIRCEDCGGVLIPGMPHVCTRTENTTS